MGVVKSPRFFTSFVFPGYLDPLFEFVIPIYSICSTK